MLFTHVFPALLIYFDVTNKMMNSPELKIDAFGLNFSFMAEKNDKMSNFSTSFTNLNEKIR